MFNLNDVKIRDLGAEIGMEPIVGSEQLTVETLRATDDPSKMGVKFDDGKIRFDLLPPEGPKAVATILAVGAKKYAARNWEQGMDWSRPFAAMQRHLWAWWAGEKNDPDSGLPHLWHAACNCFFLIAYESRSKGTDDRPRP